MIHATRQMIFTFCVFVVAFYSSYCSILEDHLDIAHRITNPQEIKDVTQLRQVAGYLIRICDEDPLNDIKFEEAVEKIRTLSDIIFTPERLSPLIEQCTIGKAAWEIIKNSKFGEYLEDLEHPLVRMMFEELIWPGNELLRDYLEDFLKAVSLELSELQIGVEVDILNIFFNEKHGIDLGFVPKAFSDSLKIFLVMYFNSIDFHIKKNLIATLIEMPPGTSVIKAFFIALKECGPTLQKIFQLLMDEAANEELEDIHIALKTLCTQMSDEDFIKVVIVAFGTMENFFGVFRSFESHAAAAATVGQGHYATLRSDNSSVFVKIKKYQIEHKMRLDFELMRQVAVQYPQYDGIYQEL